MSKEENPTDAASSSIISRDALAEEALKHIDFLKRLHSLCITLETPSQKSLDRYLNYWLPLAEKHQENGENFPLVPPPDIAWLWHCHRLAPTHYERHCRRRFGMLVDVPASAFQFQEEDDSDDNKLESKEAEVITRDLWKTMFPGEPFFLAYDTCSNNKEEHDKTHRGSHHPVNIQEFLNKEFDLLGSTERQATFLWQVSGERFADPEFRRSGVDKYIRFLSLYRGIVNGEKPAFTPLVPTYQIDLIWHTHMLKSLKQYNDDCKAICGRKFHHDDSLNDRTEGGTLDQAFQSTCDLWKKTYGKEYVVSGGMYRGEPPDDYWDPEWQPIAISSEHDFSSLGVAIVAGSFSAGTPGDADDAPPVWLQCDPMNCNRHTYHGDPTYFPPRPKSTQRGVNNNEQQEGYVFGVPMKVANSHRKAGYYHIYTKEGFEILIRRLQRRCQVAKHRYEAFLCDQCACFSGVKGLSPAQLQQYEQRERDYQNLHKLLMHARAQYESEGPGAVLSPQVIAKYGLDKEDGTEDRSRAVCTGAGCGVYAFAYVGAAGCGACGGGACGGGCACGGGGCGGGGCGGG